MSCGNKWKEVWERQFGASEKGIDRCGAEMYKRSHGKRSEQGWEVDHIKPEALGGSCTLRNLRPLHWKNNRAKGIAMDGKWTCAKS